MKTPKGFVALISLLVIMAVLVSIGLSIAAVGRNEIVLSGIFQDGERAFSIADACVEEGIVRLKTDEFFSGTSFSLDDGTCTVTVTNLGGNARFIQGTGAYQEAIRVVEAEATIVYNGLGNAVSVKIDSWKEAD